MSPYVLAPAMVLACLAILDLADRLRERPPSLPPGGLRAGTVVFLAGVLLVFLLIQWAGSALAPSVTAIASGIDAGLAPLRGRDTSAASAGALTVTAVTVLSLYLGGLWDYLLHRHVLHGRWLWFAHEYHHLPSQVFLMMPGLAARPFAALAVLPALAATLAGTSLLLALSGLPPLSPSALQATLGLQVCLVAASHSCFLRRSWRLHRVLSAAGLTSPQAHVLHHAVEAAGNYGNFVIVWDRLFGTYVEPTPALIASRRYGLPYDQDFLGTITLGRLKLPAAWRERFQVGRYCNLGAGTGPTPETPDR